MSFDLIVYLQRVSMPTPTQWAQAIRAAGFPVELDEDFDADTATGFRPCQFRGALSGFEYYSERLTDEQRQEVGAPAGCDFSVTLATHSDLRELATSLIAAGVLCEASGGLLVDPQAGDQIPAFSVVAWVRDQLASFEAELK